MEFARLKKNELVQITTQLHQENKELRKALDNIKTNSNKPYTAVSVAKVDGEFSSIKVQFNMEDVIEMKKHGNKPHMADYTARGILDWDIIKSDQVITTKENQDV